jgi:ABC-2 type transport system permease protein
MNASVKLVVTELRLQARDWSAMTFGVLFPATLLVLLGFTFPGFRDPNPDLGGSRLIDLYTPILLVFVLVMVGIGATAGVLASYRHDGILRRLRTTPIGPLRLLSAQLAAQLLVALAGLALAVVVALTVLEVPGPQHWPGALAALLLAATAVFAIGLLIGAVAPSTSAANGIATISWLPLMVLAGLWFPREVMPDTMRVVSDYSPGGAAVAAVQDAWFAGEVRPGSLAVLFVSTLVVGGLAAVVFRWD